MIGKIALKYFKRGFNCSQCILKACDDFYGLSLGESCFDMLKCVSNGFGIGSLCSILSAGVMVLGLMFEENKVKSLRIRFLTEAAEALGGTNCPEIRRNMKSPSGCERAVETAGDLLEKIIEENTV